MANAPNEHHAERRQFHALADRFHEDLAEQSKQGKLYISACIGAFVSGIDYVFNLASADAQRIIADSIEEYLAEIRARNNTKH